MSLGSTANLTSRSGLPGPLILLTVTCCGLLLGIVATRHVTLPTPPVPDIYEGASSVELPPLARKVFACISFHYDVQHLAHLKLTITTLRAYPTSVHMCIITDQADLLLPALAVWNFKHVALCPRDDTAARVDEFNIGKNIGKHFITTWQYHTAFAEAISEGFSAYLLLEDDLSPSWPAFRSWANDAQILEPLKFQRCFFRTEFAPETGRVMLLDQRKRVNSADWPWTVKVDVDDGNECSVAGTKGSKSLTAGGAHGGLLESPANCQHSHFLQMPQPYQGMFAATHSRMLAYMNSSLWDPVKALSAKGHFLDMWHVPERANSVIQLVDRPRGWHSACVVPFFPELDLLAPVAHIEHERVRYSLSPKEIEKASSIPMDTFFETALAKLFDEVDG